MRKSRVVGSLSREYSCDDDLVIPVHFPTVVSRWFSALKNFSTSFFESLLVCNKFRRFKLSLIRGLKSV